MFLCNFYIELEFNFAERKKFLVFLLLHTCYKGACKCGAVLKPVSYFLELKYNYITHLPIIVFSHRVKISTKESTLTGHTEVQSEA